MTARQASPMVVSMVRAQSCGRLSWSERISRLYAALTRYTWRVCPSGAHYPIAWRRCKTREACQKDECTAHTELCIALSNDAMARGIPGDFTFDSSFTSAKVLNHLASTKRAYVGDLKLNRWSVSPDQSSSRPNLTS